MADKYRSKPFHIVFANPFKHFESVYPKNKDAADKVGVSGRRNFTFHKQTTHPLVSKHASPMTPGWNTSNGEITANKKSYICTRRNCGPFQPLLSRK